jgi:hypothetical protein
MKTGTLAHADIPDIAEQEQLEELIRDGSVD